MTFTSLAADLQIIELYQFELFSKAFWFLFIISFSLIYIYYIKPNEEKTPFMSISFLRGMINDLSYINLFSIPLLPFIMSPEWFAWDALFVYYTIYIIVLSIFALTYLGDFIKYGIGTMMIHGGLKIEDENVQLAYKKLWGKHGRR